MILENFSRFFREHALPLEKHLNAQGRPSLRFREGSGAACYNHSPRDFAAMPQNPTESLIRRIHAADGQMVIAVTGGGSQAIGRLLSIPGGSRTMLEAIIPYSSQSLEEFLHTRPESFCSPRTARLMAMAAFQRARHLAPSDHTGRNAVSTSNAIGIACTASLASDRPKRGPHRIHVAFQSAAQTVTHSLELMKGRRDRSEEELIAANMLLNCVAEAFEINEQLELPLVETEPLESVATPAPVAWQELMFDTRQSVFHSTGDRTDVRVVFPGAFNPLHAGHLQMADIAARRLNAPVHFEISVENVDKPPLDYTEMDERAAQFAGNKLPLWFTRAPTFAEKALLFPKATFIVGADTIVRIGRSQYYPASNLDVALEQIARQGCRFLVFGRVCDGKYATLADLSLPDSLRRLCDEVTGAEFREDVSSTELRQAKCE
jgi:nicotinamide mononucleotide (NMN) deamidase PncC